MPHTLVSCGAGHSSRGTRILPYAYWGSERQSERAPARRENATWTRVLDCQIDRDTADKVKDWTPAGGRRPTKGRSGAEHERQRWRNEEAKQERVWSNIQNWGTRDCQFSEKEWFVSGILSWGDCHFFREFFNFKRAINKKSRRWNRSWRETDRIHSQSKTNDTNESTTGQWYNV